MATILEYFIKILLNTFSQFEVMPMPEGQSYVVLCKFDTKSPNSTAYDECSTLEDVYKFFTKLGIQVFQRRNPTASPDQIEFRRLIDSLKSIPFLKVYWHDPSSRMNYLEGTVNFSRGYKANMSRASDKVTNTSQELSTKQQFLKSEGQNAIGNINSERENA